MPRWSWRSSCRTASTADADPGQSPIVQAMFASFSDRRPTVVSTGNMKNVPPPAAAFTAAAPPATSAIGSRCVTSPPPRRP